MDFFSKAALRTIADVDQNLRSHVYSDTHTPVPYVINTEDEALLYSGVKSMISRRNGFAGTR